MAKQKAGGFGSGRGVGSGSGSGRRGVDELLGSAFSQLRRAMKRDYVVTSEYQWTDNEQCPCCMKRVDMAWLSLGRGAAHVSAWYYNEKELLIFYWLCRECSSRLQYAGSLNGRKMSEAIEQNTLNAWRRDNMLN